MFQILRKNLRIYIAVIIFLTLNNFSTAQSLCIDSVPTNTGNRNAARGTSSKDVIWDLGQTIRIKFLDGNTSIQSKVMEYANEWTTYANLHFSWVNWGPAEVRISFKGKGHQSVLGKNALNVKNQNEATMNLELIGETDNEEIKRVVLHEFGHAIGLLHEHQNPSSEVNIFNESAIYAYFAQTQGWSVETIRYNILERYSVSQSNGQYDRKSIMHYRIPARFMLNGIEYPENYVLSTGDKKLVAELYPLSKKVNSSFISVSRFSSEIEYEVNIDGKRGIKIYPKFQIDNAQNKSIQCAAYFYFTTGKALKDYNNVYKSENGNVSVGKKVLPGFQSTSFNQNNSKDYFLFIPYEELHLKRDTYHKIKYHLELWDGNNSLGKTEDTMFWYFDGSKNNLIINNESGRKVKVSIHFEDLEGNWKTKHWYELQPNQRARLDGIMTKNRNIYYYVEDERVKWTWNGEEYFETIGNKKYGFRKFYVDNDNWGDQTLKLSSGK